MSLARPEPDEEGMSRTAETEEAQAAPFARRGVTPRMETTDRYTVTLFDADGNVVRREECENVFWGALMFVVLEARRKPGYEVRVDPDTEAVREAIRARKEPARLESRVTTGNPSNSRHFPAPGTAEVFVAGSIRASSVGVAIVREHGRERPPIIVADVGNTVRPVLAALAGALEALDANLAVTIHHRTKHYLDGAFLPRRMARLHKAKHPVLWKRLYAVSEGRCVTMHNVADGDSHFSPMLKLCKVIARNTSKQPST
jgi:hypothetical protein